MEHGHIFYLYLIPYLLSNLFIIKTSNPQVSNKHLRVKVAVSLGLFKGIR